MKAGAIIVLLLMVPASAETLGEMTGVDTMLGRPPAAADVVRAIHQFDLFASGAGDLADMRASDAMRKAAAARTNRAKARDKQIAHLAAKLSVKLSDDPDAVTANKLAGLQGKVGADFVANYRASLTGEYISMTTTLRRYLDKPDDDAVKAFAARALPELSAEMTSAQKIASPEGGAK